MLPSLLTSGVAGAQVKTESGAVEGTESQDARVRIFRGIPFAAPPVGELRWQAPHPVAAWQGVRKATAFGNRCMQAPIFADMIFRDEVSEDCLYLNVWTPAKRAPSGCRSWCGSTAAASWPAPPPSRATTARGSPARASWSSASTTGSASSASSRIRS